MARRSSTTGSSNTPPGLHQKSHPPTEEEINNAQELIEGLTLTYNKARQARITTELIEIISGAASLDG